MHGIWFFSTICLIVLLTLNLTGFWNINLSAVDVVVNANLDELISPKPVDLTLESRKPAHESPHQSNQYISRPPVMKPHKVQVSLLPPESKESSDIAFQWVPKRLPYQQLSPRLESIRKAKLQKYTDENPFSQPKPPVFEIHFPVMWPVTEQLQTSRMAVQIAEAWIRNSQEAIRKSKCPICVEHFTGMAEIWEKYIRPRYYNSAEDRPEAPYKGTYIEMGALDGISGSNTLFLDEALQWHGLLIEPSPPNYASLVQNRPYSTRMEVASCECHNTADSKPLCEMEFVGDGGGVGGGVDALKPRYKTLRQRVRHAYKVNCAPMSYLLAQAGLTRVDFWSLDNEGGELITLRSVDWSKVSVWLLLVEFNPVFENLNELAMELTHAGFVLEARMGTMNQLWRNPNYV